MTLRLRQVVSSSAVAVAVAAETCLIRERDDVVVVKACVVSCVNVNADNNVATIVDLVDIKDLDFVPLLGFFCCCCCLFTSLDVSVVS